MASDSTNTHGSRGGTNTNGRGRGRGRGTTRYTQGNAVNTSSSEDDERRRRFIAARGNAARGNSSMIHPERQPIGPPAGETAQFKRATWVPRRTPTDSPRAPDVTDANDTTANRDPDTEYFSVGGHNTRTPEGRAALRKLSQETRAKTNALLAEATRIKACTEAKYDHLMKKNPSPILAEAQASMQGTGTGITVTSPFVVLVGGGNMPNAGVPSSSFDPISPTLKKAVLMRREEHRRKASMSRTGEQARIQSPLKPSEKPVVEGTDKPETKSSSSSATAPSAYVTAAHSPSLNPPDISILANPEDITEAMSTLLVSAFDAAELEDVSITPPNAPGSARGDKVKDMDEWVKVDDEDLAIDDEYEILETPEEGEVEHNGTTRKWYKLYRL